MMNTVLALNEIAFASGNREVGSRSQSSGGRSQAEKGKSFADSPPLAEARAERPADTEAQPREKVRGEKQDEQGGVSPAPETSAPKPQQSIGRNRNRVSENAGKVRDSKPDEPAKDGEQPVVPDGSQMQTPAETVVAQLCAESPESGMVDVQTCQVVASAPPQDAAVPTGGAESIRADDRTSAASAVTAGDAVQPQKDVPVVAATTQLAHAVDASGIKPKTEIRSAPPSESPAVVPDATPQKSDAASQSPAPAAIAQAVPETVIAQQPSGKPVVSDAPSRIDSVTSDQSLVRESQQGPSALTNQQTVVEEAEIGRNQGSQPQTAGRADKGVSQRSSPQGFTAPLSAGKNEGEAAATQTNQDVPQGASPVLSDISSAATSRASAQEVAAQGTDATGSKSSSQDIAEQIGSALRTGLDRAGKQLTIHLKPPELGNVVVRLDEQGQGIKAVLEVSRPETGRDIEQALPQVVKNLQDAGFQVRKFDVVVSEQLDKEAGSGSASQDAWKQQQTWSGAEGRQDGASRSPWSSWNGQQSGHSDLGGIRDSQGVGPRGGIDLLA
jgi:flagellar hook-length control protein FliK